MNTQEIATELRLSHWAGIMRERAESGLSIKAFCKNAGFHQNVYFYWQRKLREAACTRLLDVQAGNDRKSPATFTEVNLKAPKMLSAPEASEPGEVRIEIAGVRIAADSTYPPTTLAELVRGLARIC